ncbi:MAG: competence/damage-inducible protein A [Clostridiales bacterium]|nr:competence/damage-inducible protein A [Clostridiales bacterium]
MIVELISVGTELLLGNTINTNANYLSKKCAQLGLTNYYQVTVGDNEDRLFSAINTALSRSDILILTGGLGPTNDDLTKEVTARVVGKELVQDLEVKRSLKEYFERSNRKNIPSNNWKQTYIIEGSRIIENKNGTAPGLLVETDNNKIIMLLPGPPRELIPMFESSVMPYLKEIMPGTFYSETIKMCGFGESQAVTIVEDLIEEQTNPTIAPYAKPGEVHFRITASAKDEEEGKELVRPLVDEFKIRFSNHIFTTKEDENLEDVVVDLLKRYDLGLSTAESCTGGLLSGRIINVPGASSVFDEGFITYSNEAKEKHLGVKKETLNKYGAVSKETALEMAQGVAKNTGKDAGLAITGIAGPGGGSKEKPVGLVYIACYLNGKVEVREYVFNGDRQTVRERSVIHALDLLRILIVNQYVKNN